MTHRNVILFHMTNVPGVRVPMHVIYQLMAVDAGGFRPRHLFLFSVLCHDFILQSFYSFSGQFVSNSDPGRINLCVVVKINVIVRLPPELTHQ